MERKGFIGGSDCVKIMEGEWEELWEVKTGLKEPESLLRNLPVQLGIHTENFNLKWFAIHEAKAVVAHQKEYIASINNIPVKGTIDGAIQGENNIIEAKHTNNFYNTNTTNSEWNTRVGRHIFNLSWSYVQDTDMWRVQDDVTNEFTGNDTSIENLLIDKVHGSHLPFIFQIDDSNYSDGFYLVRMTKHSMQQTSPNLWTFSCTLEEEL